MKGLNTRQAESGWYHGARQAFVPVYDGMKAFVFLQAAEKAFQLRSQSIELFDVPNTYASGFSSLAALLGSRRVSARLGWAGEKVRLFDQPVKGRVTRWHA